MIKEWKKYFSPSRGSDPSQTATATRRKGDERVEDIFENHRKERTPQEKGTLANETINREYFGVSNYGSIRNERP